MTKAEKKIKDQGVKVFASITGIPVSTVYYYLKNPSSIPLSVALKSLKHGIEFEDWFDVV